MTPHRKVLRENSATTVSVNRSGRTIFTKQYADPQRAQAAAAHHRWLTSLQAVHMPALIEKTGSGLIFAHLDGHHPEPGDLVTVAATMGALHAAAWEAHLHRADLDRPFRCGELVITDFVSPRRRVLAQFPEAAVPRPAALYKDCNIRNFLMTDNRVSVIDFDDLTLAPFGYDLAKLVVSSAMTHGRPDPATIAAVLDAYNDHIPGPAACPQELLQIYTGIHHDLTIAYLHRNGYRYRWPDVSPWTDSRPAR